MTSQQNVRVIQVGAQFTEFDTSDVDTPCGRNVKARNLCIGSGIILAGAPKFFVNNNNPEKPGRYVCEACYNTLTKSQTSVITAQERTVTVVPTTHCVPDVNIIRKNTNQSWQTGAHATAGPRVSAMSQHSHHMMPPPSQVPTTASAQTVHSHGPVIPSPLAMLPGSMPVAAAEHGVPFGYSNAHAFHAQETEQWRTRAYAPAHSQELKQLNGTGPLGIHTSVKLDVTVFVYLPSNETDKNGNAIRVKGVKETIRVPLLITFIGLVHTIHHEMEGPIRSFLGPEIPFDITRTVIRETTGKIWRRVNVTDENRVKEYFEGRFMKPPKQTTTNANTSSSGARKVSNVLQLPKTPPEFGVVLYDHVWQLYLAKEDGTYISSTSTSQPHLAASKTAASQNSTSTAPTIQSQSTLPRSKRKAKSTEIIEVPASAKNKRSKKQVQIIPSSHKSSDDDIYVSDGPPTVVPVATGDEPSALKSAENAPILSSMRERLSKARTQFNPIDAGIIRCGFSEGGISSAKNVNTMRMLVENILFYPLPDISIDNLITNPGQEIIATEDFCHAKLTYDPENKLGQGSFKTAMRASLEFDGRKPAKGLGSDVDIGSSILVALKRPFVNNTRVGASAGPATRSSAKLPSATPIKRMGLADERQAVTGEAKLLVWANALLSFAYSFIEHYVAIAMDEQRDIPSFIDSIPNFRFVKAGVAGALKSIETTQGGARPSSNRAVYLLEEMLPEEAANFVKYINNAKAVSALAIEDPDYPYTEFLLFIQHVQWQTTHGSAFLTDFQGVGTILTDPQIITNPELGDNLFGGGNLRNAFAQFPQEHTCNKYCKWFNLAAL